MTRQYVPSWKNGAMAAFMNLLSDVVNWDIAFLQIAMQLFSSWMLL